MLLFRITLKEYIIFQYKSNIYYVWHKKVYNEGISKYRHMQKVKRT